jgi:hypothetical protein
VGDNPPAALEGRVDFDVRSSQPIGHFGPLETDCVETNPYEIGLHICGFDRTGETLGEANRQLVCELVVFGQTLPLGQTDSGCGCDHARLTHRTAHPSPEIPDLGDRVLAPADNRPDGCAQTFGKTELDGVGEGTPGWPVNSGGGHCVPDASTVDVDTEAVIPGPGRRRLHQIEGDDPTSRQVVGVLPGHKGDPWEESGQRHGVVDIVGKDLSTWSIDGAEPDPG